MIYFGNMFLKLISYIYNVINCFITELNPKILANFLLNWCYIMDESKYETKLFRTHNGLERVSTISQILLEIPESSYQC